MQAPKAAQYQRAAPAPSAQAGSVAERSSLGAGTTASGSLDRWIALSLRELIREVPDFPEPGVSFKDITTLLADPVGFSATIDELCAPFREAGIDLRGRHRGPGVRVLGPGRARLGAGLIPIRKPGKLPAAVDSVTYELEYGGGTLEIHLDALPPAPGC